MLRFIFGSSKISFKIVLLYESENEVIKLKGNQIDLKNSTLSLFKMLVSLAEVAASMHLEE